MLHSHVLYIELYPLGKTEQACLSLSVYPIGWKEFREFCHDFMIPQIDPMIRVDDSCEIWKELAVVLIKMARQDCFSSFNSFYQEFSIAVVVAKLDSIVLPGHGHFAMTKKRTSVYRKTNLGYPVVFSIDSPRGRGIA